MILRLRRSFVGITMTSVVLVLVVLMGAINTANYLSKDSSNAQMLQMLADNSGRLPDFTTPPDKPDGTDDTTPPDKPTDDTTATPRNWSPETPYEMRYFSVALDADGSTSSVDTGKIAAISSSDAIDMAQRLYAADKTHGYSGNYKYLAVTNDGTTTYIFLDCTRDLDSVRQFLRYSLLISLGGTAAIFLVAVALSRRAVRPIAESYEKQKHFITDAGHEIKTPLAIIASCTDVLELEQGESKWSQGIRSQVERLTELTRDLVSLARMDERSGNLTMEDVDFSTLLANTLEPFTLVAQSRGQTLTLDTEETVTLKGDRRALEQLCSILADNAVKYTPENGHIAFALRRRGRKVVLTEENDADGMTQGGQKQLFDRFYRGDQSRSSQKPGYGIGLSMAQSITAAHGGKIDAVSKDGKSLTITVQF